SGRPSAPPSVKSDFSFSPKPCSSRSPAGWSGPFSAWRGHSPVAFSPRFVFPSSVCPRSLQFLLRSLLGSRFALFPQHAPRSWIRWKRYTTSKRLFEAATLSVEKGGSLSRLPELPQLPKIAAIVTGTPSSNFSNYQFWQCWQFRREKGIPHCV